MARGAKKTAEAPLETEVGTEKVPTQVSRKVRIRHAMTYYRGRFYQKGEVLEVTADELEVLKGYVDEVE